MTSGPGVTNAVTGIATAYMDSIPMVVLTGQVPTHAIGMDAFQECDTVGITRPIVKHNFLVKDARDIADVMKKAFHIARSGRPGPVLVDLPFDVQMAEIEFDIDTYEPLPVYKPAATPAQATPWCRRSHFPARCRSVGRLARMPVDAAGGLGARAGEILCVRDWVARALTGVVRSLRGLCGW